MAVDLKTYLASKNQSGSSGPVSLYDYMNRRQGPMAAAVPEKEPGITPKQLLMRFVQHFEGAAGGGIHTLGRVFRTGEAYAGDRSKPIPTNPVEGFFEKAAQEAFRASDMAAEQTYQGKDKLSKVADVVAGGLGSAAVDVPKYALASAALGPMGMAALGGAEGYIGAQEAGQNAVTGALKGAAMGEAMQLGLGAGRMVPGKGLMGAAARRSAGAAIFGGPTLINELTKPENERDFSNAVGEAIVGFALTHGGKEPITFKKFVQESVGYRPRAKLNPQEEALHQKFMNHIEFRFPKLYDQLKALPFEERVAASRKLYTRALERYYAKKEESLADQEFSARNQMPPEEQAPPSTMQDLTDWGRDWENSPTKQIAEWPEQRLANLEAEKKLIPGLWAQATGRIEPQNLPARVMPDVIGERLRTAATREQRIQDLTRRIQAGEKDFSPEDLQMYQNNRAEIEKRLQKAVTEPQTPGAYLNPLLRWADAVASEPPVPGPQKTASKASQRKALSELQRFWRELPKKEDAAARKKIAEKLAAILERRGQTMAEAELQRVRDQFPDVLRAIGLGGETIPSGPEAAAGAVPGGRETASRSTSERNAGLTEDEARMQRDNRPVEELSEADEAAKVRGQRKLKRQAVHEKNVAGLGEMEIVLDESMTNPSDGTKNVITDWQRGPDGLIHIRIENHDSGSIRVKLVTVRPGDKITSEMDDAIPGTTRYDENPLVKKRNPSGKAPGGAQLPVDNGKIIRGEEWGKSKVETDPAKRQEIKNSIAEGEMILKSGRKTSGEKMTPGELNAVRRAVENSRARLGESEPTEPLPKTTVKLADLKVGDRFIDADMNEPLRVTRKFTDPKTGKEKITLQDGKARNYDADSDRSILGKVNGPETTFSGQRPYEEPEAGPRQRKAEERDPFMEGADRNPTDRPPWEGQKIPEPWETPKAKPATEKPAPAEEPIPGPRKALSPVKSDGEIKKSRAFQRVKDRFSSMAEEDSPEYREMNIEENTAKAVMFVQDHPSDARKIAFGVKGSGTITDTAITFAYADKMYQSGNWQEAAAVETSLSLRSTRRGQEIASLKGRTSGDTPADFIKTLVNARMREAARSMGERKSTKPVTQAIKETTGEIKGRLERAKMNDRDLVDIFTKLTCRL